MLHLNHACNFDYDHSMYTLFQHCSVLRHICDAIWESRQMSEKVKLQNKGY